MEWQRERERCPSSGELLLDSVTTVLSVLLCPVILLPLQPLKQVCVLPVRPQHHFLAQEILRLTRYNLRKYGYRKYSLEYLQKEKGIKLLLSFISTVTESKVAAGLLRLWFDYTFHLPTAIIMDGACEEITQNCHK